ncbi:MAG: efflux RND transporter periplasmic adaptor subunit [Rhizobiaceae bacterium]
MKTIIVTISVEKIERSYSAVVLPAQEVELSFRVSGRIKELPVRSGQNVKKGDVIAELDKRDFQAEVTRLQSQLEQADAQLSVLTSGARAEDVAALEAAVAAVEAEVEAARDQLNRSERLFEQRVVSKAKVDQDKTAVRVAEAELEARRQELAKGTAGARAEDVAAQEAAIKGLKSNLQSLEDNLEDATLRAPFDGIVATRAVDNFANVQAKEEIVRLQALTTPNLTFDVPAADVPAFAKAEKLDLSVVLDSIPGTTFEAERREFSTQADPSTQTFRGRVAIQNPKREPVLPGMTGVVTVAGSEAKKGRLMVPISAVAAEPDGKSFVWVVAAENRVNKRPVTTGEASGGSVSIADGLQEGNVVVTAGLSALQENMAVKPISAIGE